MTYIDAILFVLVTFTGVGFVMGLTVLLGVGMDNFLDYRDNTERIIGILQLIVGLGGILSILAYVVYFLSHAT